VAPGQWGVSDTPDAIFGKTMVAPRESVDWNNRLTDRSLLSISMHRPVRHAGSIREGGLAFDDVLRLEVEFLRRHAGLHK
jgi:hypothetical protein